MIKPAILAALDTAALQGLVDAGKDAIVVMQQARSVIVSKHELALLTKAVTDLRASLSNLKGTTE